MKKFFSILYVILLLLILSSCDSKNSNYIDLSVIKYHLCLAPANGSGIKATTACTVFVTGSYTVK